MSGALLSCRGARLSLGGRPILDGIDLDLFPGEVVALVGPNGAGKSTLLAALSGDVVLDAGSIALQGLELSRWSVADLARLRAVQMQDARVSFSFTAEDVIRMGRAPWNRTAFEDRDEEIVQLAAQASETRHLGARVFPTLSGGEKSRVAFARVLAQESHLILLDEPTAAMDIRYQELVLTRTRERAAAGASAVVVLHDLTLAAAYADRVVLMSSGAIRAAGTPRQVFTPAILEEVYRHPVTVIDLPDDAGLAVVPTRTHLRAPRTEQKELV